MNLRSALGQWLLPVPGERRVAVVCAGTALLCAAVIGIAGAAAWNAQARSATVALIVAIGALTVACAALAGYVIWLRARVSRRMREVLHPYLATTTVRARARTRSRVLVGEH